MRLKVQEAFFYEDRGMVAFANPGWLQTVFDKLMVLFDWVELKTNFRKTVKVLYQPCWKFRVGEDKAYTQRMIGVGRS